jgi:hypothetical protein
MTGTLVALMIFTSGVAGGSGRAAEDLVHRAFFNLYAQDYIQTIELVTYPRGGRGMKRKIQVIRKQSSESGKALLRFVAPSYVRGTSVLIIENDSIVDDIYIYIPAARITRHLTSSQKSDAFFGTDLAYEDFEPKKIGDYKVRMLGACASVKKSRKLVEISAKPRMGSGYERMVSCIEDERGIIVWTEFYRKGDVVKRLEVELGSVKEIGMRFVPFKMKMKDLRRGSFTMINTEDFRVVSAIPEKLFSTRNLELGNSRRDRAAIESEGSAERDLD